MISTIFIKAATKKDPVAAPEMATACTRHHPTSPSPAPPQATSSSLLAIIGMKLQQHEITSPSQTYKLPGRMGIKSAAPAAVDTAPNVDAAVQNRSNLKIVPPRIIKMVKTVL